MTAKLALIAGGCGGIGSSVARLLAPDHDLALGYADNHERAEAVRKEIKLSYPAVNVHTFGGRLRNYQDAMLLVRNVRDQFGQSPSVLVNLTGGIYDALFLNSEFDRHLSLVQEHLIVVMALCHAVLKDMYKARFGRIVNVSSVSASYAKRGQCSYSAAKAGIEAFSRTLALEVAHRGITVNVIAPGLIDTDLSAQVITALRGKAGSIEGRIPVGHVGRPDDVGSLARFLCSDQAGYITGAVHTVDGGRSLGDPSS